MAAGYEDWCARRVMAPPRGPLALAYIAGVLSGIFIATVASRGPAAACIDGTPVYGSRCPARIDTVSSSALISGLIYDLF